MALHSASMDRTLRTDRAPNTTLPSTACQQGPSQRSSIDVAGFSIAVEVICEFAKRLELCAVSDLHEGVGRLRCSLRLREKLSLVRLHSTCVLIRPVVLFLTVIVCRCQGLTCSHQSDCLIVAGDVSDNLDTFEATLKCLAGKWKVC